MLVGLGEGRSFGSVYWMGDEAVEEMDMLEGTSSQSCTKENIIALGVVGRR